MSIRKTSFMFGEFYHIYNRGNSKQVIFLDKQDYNRFLFLLYALNTKENIILRLVLKDMYKFDRGERLVSIGAYCLMSNHFHLLLTENVDGGISKFMQKITTAYSMYFNEKYKRTGGLFEGKFKSEFTDRDEYLKYLFAYIHLNPIKIIDKRWKVDKIRNKEKSLTFLKNYPYSSYIEYLGFKRLEGSIINRDAFPGYLPTEKDFSEEIFDWLSFND